MKIVAIYLIPILGLHIVIHLEPVTAVLSFGVILTICCVARGYKICQKYIKYPYRWLLDHCHEDIEFMAKKFNEEAT